MYFYITRSFTANTTLEVLLVNHTTTKILILETNIQALLIP